MCVTCLLRVGGSVCCYLVLQSAVVACVGNPALSLPVHCAPPYGSIQCVTHTHKPRSPAG
eukprot:6735206-Prymnesium_polylepis.1